MVMVIVVVVVVKAAFPELSVSIVVYIGLFIEFLCLIVESGMFDYACGAMMIS